MNRFVIIIIFFLIMLGCSQKQPCENIPKRFNAYSELENVILGTKFNYIDEFNTSKSSWIRNVKFYSCDKKFGFLIIETDKQNYIHEKLPINIWYKFKNAESFGTYYNKSIKNKYKCSIN